MHHRLAQLLADAGRSLLGVDIFVDRHMMSRPDDGAAVTHYVSSQIANMLGRFVADKKLLDGADKSGFSMEHDLEKDGMRCRARVHVFTPAELETLLKQAFDAGRSSSPNRPYLPFSAGPWTKQEYPSDSF